MEGIHSPFFLFNTAQPIRLVQGSHHFELFNNLLVKTYEDNLIIFQPAFFDLLDQRFNNFRPTLNFHKDLFALGDSGKNIADQGHSGTAELFILPSPYIQFFEIGERGLSYHQFLPSQTLGVLIVKTNDLVILGQQKVTLHRIRSLLTKFKGSQGIFGASWEDPR